MSHRLTNDDSELVADEALRGQLADVLERYLADLENGSAPDHQSLLAQHAEIADELRPYLDSLRMLHGATREMRVNTFTAGAGPNDAHAHRQIGEYRIVREIGRGGMGIVYEAHQKSLNRQVALKILPFAAVLDQKQIARFRNEAQAAAQLHHSHIVPVFAVGQEQGVYYYAMQYIEGRSLEQAIGELRQAANDRADRSTKAGGAVNGSTTTMHVHAGKRWSERANQHADFFRAVARLGIEAAEALHHAHEHGILHRDVKPSNLLLDEQGKLWVTDFGLARMQSDSGVTLTGDVVGTLRYMSPEQASGQPLIDARTDVYSLGATLYELLTRRHAHPGGDRQSLLRQIVDEEPIAPRRIDPAVPVDLETIVLSAMSKSLGERYASARALAEDLDRFLAGKPTLARRPSLVDRAAKLARRHRSLVATAASAMLVLSIVSVVALVLVLREQARTSVALFEAKQSAQAAHDNFARAEKHFQQARGAVDQFGIGLADRLLEIPGAETVRRDLLVAALDYYHQFVVEAGNDPQLRRETALAHFKSAAIAAKLGATEDAITEYRAAEEILAQLSMAEPSSAELSAQLALTHNNLGLLLAARGDAVAARTQYDAATVIQQRLVKEHPDDATAIGQLAESQANLGMLLDQLGDGAGAERSLSAARDVLRSIAASQSNDSKSARNLAIVSNNLSYVLRKRDPAAANRASREAIAILQRLADGTAGSAEYQGDLALCYNNLAALEIQKRQWDEAISWHLQAIALQEQLARKAPGVVRHRSDLAVSLNNLGVANCRAGRSTDADASFERARSLLATLSGDYPDQVAYSSSLAALLNNQALALADAGRHEDALQVYPTAIKAQRECWQRLPDAAAIRESLSKMYYNYGQSLRSTTQFSAAADAAVARRELWQGNGERLFGVAVELAEIAGAWRTNTSTSPGDDLRKLDLEIIRTLRAARESGWHDEADLAADDRFAFLRQDKQFAQLIADAVPHNATTEARTGDAERTNSSHKN
ncbi:MAG: serine/threonine-protein kinase [Pirellulales bacterium]